MEKSIPRTVKSQLGLIVLAYIAFIALGLPDGLLGVAWPSLQVEFGLPLDALGMLLIASTTGYMTSSFLSGQLVARMGVGGLLAASCALTGAALLGYTLAPTWWVMVLLGVAAGFGAGAIDAGINTYVAANFGEGLMQWLHASYGIGITLSPIIMTAALSLFGAWRMGYRAVSTAQIVLAACFLLTIPLWRRKPAAPAGSGAQEEKPPQSLTDYKTPIGETLRRPPVWRSLLMFLLYVGAEVTMGTWTYSLLTQSRAVAADTAGLVTGSFWAMFTIGRVVAGLFTRKLNGHNLILFATAAALTGAILLWWNPAPAASVLGIAVAGFAIAPIFPGLMSGTEARVGARHAANTIGMQITAAGLSAALLPGLAGVLAQRLTLEIIPPYLCLLFSLLLVLYVTSLRRNRAE